MGHRDPEYALFPTEEYLARVEMARGKMHEYGLDALLLTSKENVVYFSGIRCVSWGSKHRPMGVVLPASEDKPVVIVIPENLYEVSRHSSWIDEIYPWGGWRRKEAAPDPISAFHDACEMLSVQDGTIGLELGYGQRVAMSQDDFKNLNHKLSVAEFKDAGPLLWDLRMVKSDREIDAIRTACRATTKAFDRAFDMIQAGITEKELAGEILSELALHTHEPPGFAMIRSGPQKYGMVNVEPFEKPFMEGDLVVVDIGANYKYYWSDFMRMASIGPPTEDQQRFFNAEIEAQQAGVDVIKPGIRLGEVFNACYEVLLDHGMQKHVPNLERVGHGVGLDVHEPPSIAKDSEIIIQPNMVLTVEPIFWDRPNHQIGNFALEDVVLVTDDGHEVLSSFPKDLHVVV